MDDLYAPDGMYAWDFWLVRAERTWHLFHLQAPRSLHPERRHDHASVGHAVSDDARSWRYEGTVLGPGAPGAWDDHCIWTGSIIPHEGRYYLLYTGRKRGDFLIQRIGLAVSNDLHHFEKHPGNPILTADARWYHTHDGVWPKVEDWRDPYVCWIGDRFHAFVTARTRVPSASTRHALRLSYLKELLAVRADKILDPWIQASGPLAGRGCIGHATSRDLVRWTVGPPALQPGLYAAMECPQYLEHQGRSYLTFSALRGWYRRSWARRTNGGQTGLHAFWAPGPNGPWAPVNGDGVILGTDTHSYATRIIETADGLKAISWLFRQPGRRGFCGRISSPRDVLIEGDRIRVG